MIGIYMSSLPTDSYTCLKKHRFSDSSGYEIVTIRQEDMENIRLWRNAQMNVLRQKAPISFNEQQQYFHHIIPSDFNQAYPKQILLSYLLHNQCIGYGGLVHLDWESRRGEVSFLVDPTRLQPTGQYDQDFTHFLSLLAELTFCDLQLHRLHVETYAFRTDHIRVLENFGFVLEGTLRQHIRKENVFYDSLMHGLLKEEYVHAK
jgi:RimJ/RimL family protein N-acetyltransferase